MITNVGEAVPNLQHQQGWFSQPDNDQDVPPHVSLTPGTAPLNRDTGHQARLTPSGGGLPPPPKRFTTPPTPGRNLASRCRYDSMIGNPCFVSARSLHKSLIMRDVNGLVELEAILDLRELVRLGLEDEIHVVAPLEVPGVVGELAFPELLDLVQLGPLGFDLGAHGLGQVLDAILVPARVQGDQTLVLPAHLFCLVCSAC